MPDDATDMLREALGYAAMGWRVLPLHTPTKDGGCSCRKDSCVAIGKHPRTMNGLTEATVDPEQIKKWWKLWPLANIGVVTGEASGIVVIDVDNLDLAQPILDAHPQIVTTSQVTGSGGRHYIFKHPGIKTKTCAKPLPGMDSRGDGGYIVVPPSLHKTGNRYVWEIGPDEMDPVPVPEWWMEALWTGGTHSPSIRTGDTGGRSIAEGGRNEALTSFAGTLRRTGAGYETILAALLARNAESCIPPLDAEEVTTIAQSISGYEIQSQEDIELERIGGEIWAGMLEYRQLQVAELLKTDKTEKAGPAPETFMPRRGLIKDIAEHILATSITPQPLMAMAAATCLVSVLCGRKYRTWTNARPNIYMVALAGSGSGKEHPRQVVKEIMSRCNLDAHLGGSRIASGPGLFSAMLKNPVKIFLLDEFGMTLQAINSKNAAGYQREIAQTLMELYSSASSEMKSAEYADQKMRPVETIKNPCTVLYATSTHGQFYDAITSDHAASGQIARLMIINTPPEIPEDSEEFTINAVPESIIEKVKGLYGAMATIFSQALAGDTSPEPYTVPASDEVRKAWRALRKDMQRQSKDEAAASIYSRVAENAVKLALVYSCSINPEAPMMDMEAFTWGRDLALWSANTLMEQYNRYSFDTETEKYSKQIEEFVRRSDGEGVTASVMDQRLGRKFKDFEWESHKKQLFKAGILLTVTDVKNDKPGAKKTRIIHREHFDERKHAIV